MRKGVGRVCSVRSSFFSFVLLCVRRSVRSSFYLFVVLLVRRSFAHASAPLPPLHLTGVRVRRAHDNVASRHSINFLHMIRDGFEQVSASGVEVEGYED